MTPAEFSGERGQALGKIVREYEFMTCRLLSPMIFEEMKDFYDRGLQAEVIIEAIRVTREKNANWSYTRAILMRCLEEGIFTFNQWDFNVRWKKAIVTLKKRFRSFNEEKFFPFILIEAYRDELEQIERDCERFCEERRKDPWTEEEFRQKLKEMFQ